MTTPIRVRHLSWVCARVAPTERATCSSGLSLVPSRKDTIRVFRFCQENCYFSVMILGTASECHANTNGAFITLGVINALDDTTDFCVEVDFYGGRKIGEPVGKKKNSENVRDSGSNPGRSFRRRR